MSSIVKLGLKLSLVLTCTVSAQGKSAEIAESNNSNQPSGKRPTVTDRDECSGEVKLSMIDTSPERTNSVRNFDRNTGVVRYTSEKIPQETHSTYSCVDPAFLDDGSAESSTVLTLGRSALCPKKGGMFSPYCDCTHTHVSFPNNDIAQAALRALRTSGMNVILRRSAISKVRSWYTDAEGDQALCSIDPANIDVKPAGGAVAESLLEYAKKVRSERKSEN